MMVSDRPPLSKLRECGAMLTLGELAPWLGMSRAGVYNANATGSLPVQVHKLGARFYVLTADLARVLGVDPAHLLTVDGEDL